MLLRGFGSSCDLGQRRGYPTNFDGCTSIRHSVTASQHDLVCCVDAGIIYCVFVVKHDEATSPKVARNHYLQGLRARKRILKLAANVMNALLQSSQGPCYSGAAERKNMRAIRK
jgi:hypothetical protein